MLARCAIFLVFAGQDFHAATSIDCVFTTCSLIFCDAFSAAMMVSLVATRPHRSRWLSADQTYLHSLRRTVICLLAHDA